MDGPSTGGAGLPFVEQLLQETQEIIEQRGGESQGDEDPTKPYFRPLYHHGDLERYPSILNFCLSSEVLATVAHQDGLCSGLQPVFATRCPDHGVERSVQYQSARRVDGKPVLSPRPA